MTDEVPNTSPAVDAGHIPINDGPPLVRVQFDDQGPIEGEPASDVKIRTSTGLELRERMVEVAANADSAISAEAAPTSRTIVISNALLNDDGSVALDHNGKPRLSSRHEVALTNESMGRLGSVEAVEVALREARERAAALADIEFRGASLHEQVLGGRLRPAAQ